MSFVIRSVPAHPTFEPMRSNVAEPNGPASQNVVVRPDIHG